MDPCECVWNHEMAMQRLLNLLRNSQTFCAENECIQDGPLRSDPTSAGEFNSLLMIMLGWIVMATALYMLRPATMRQRPLDEKPHSNGGSNDGTDPPAPPVL